MSQNHFLAGIGAPLRPMVQYGVYVRLRRDRKSKGTWHCLGAGYHPSSLLKASKVVRSGIMHFMVALDIRVSGPERADLRRQIRRVFRPYSWVRPLPSVYILKVTGGERRVLILEELKSIANSKPQSFRFIASPLMVGGQYGGWLPKSLWAKINKRTRQDV